MTDVNPRACFACVHRHEPPVSPIPGGGPTTCSQYPGGIPEAILIGAPHDRLRGDEAQGQPFELDPAQADTERVWRGWLELVSASGR